MSGPQLVPVLASRLHVLEGLTPMSDGPPSPEDMARFAAFGAPVDGWTAPEVDVHDTLASGPHGPVRVRVYRRVDGSTPVRGLVWMHGGAFIGGDLDMPEADVVARELVDRGGTVVVSVDYRLCHGGVHFPVPHDDVHAAYLWASAGGLLPQGSPWSIGGASAGANLAAGAAQRLRDEGVPLDSVVLAYPVVHAPVPDGGPGLAARMESLPPVLRFPPEATAFLNANFLGEHTPETPYTFAGHGVVAGLPRTRVIVCEFDDLLPSGEAFAAQLAAAGVPVEVERVDGVAHGHLNVAGLAEATATIDGIAAFLAANGSLDLDA